MRVETKTTLALNSNEVFWFLCSVSGGELFERVADADCLTEKEASFYMYQLLQGLQYMHSKNIVHLDLKVANKLLIISMLSQKFHEHFIVLWSQICSIYTSLLHEAFLDHKNTISRHLSSKCSKEQKGKLNAFIYFYT